MSLQVCGLTMKIRLETPPDTLLLKVMRRSMASADHTAKLHAN